MYMVKTPQLLTTNIRYWTNNVRTAIGPKLLRCDYEHFRLPKKKKTVSTSTSFLACKNFMEATTSAANQPQSVSKRRHTARTSVEALGDDVLCMIFVLLDLVHLIRCSAVCKSWSMVISKLKLLQLQYYKQQHVDSIGLSDASTYSERLLNQQLGQLAMDMQSWSLKEGPCDVFRWKGHLQGFKKCRMKMGLILTGVGDKVMRLWSAESGKGLDEYTLPDKAPLFDFDFDEGKVVGLVGTRICIWRRVGSREIFSSREGMFARGLCMCYVDPQAVIGCEDGKVRVFDMYSRKISQIIKMHPGSVSSLCFTDEQMIISGSSLGSIAISDLSSDQQVATLGTTGSAGYIQDQLSSLSQILEIKTYVFTRGSFGKGPYHYDFNKIVRDSELIRNPFHGHLATGIRNLCFNPSSYQLFAGSSAGYASCWDIRMSKRLWETRVSPNVLYSMHHLRNDKSTLVVGGIDGVLRIVDQDTGTVLSRWIVEENGVIANHSVGKNGFLERKKGIKLSEDARIDLMPNRPPITCLAVGMQKVVTTHSDRFLRVWKFRGG